MSVTNYLVVVLPGFRCLHVQPSVGATRNIARNRWMDRRQGALVTYLQEVQQPSNFKRTHILIYIQHTIYIQYTIHTIYIYLAHSQRKKQKRSKTCNIQEGKSQTSNAFTQRDREWGREEEMVEYARGCACCYIENSFKYQSMLSSEETRL